MILRYSEARLPTPQGEFRVVVYRTGEAAGPGATAVGMSSEEHVAMVLGDIRGGDVLTRVHSSCFTGEVLGSLRCDCRAQLDAALDRIGREGRGVLVYLVQEGRGIGLGNKIPRPKARSFRITPESGISARPKHLFGHHFDHD